MWEIGTSVGGRAEEVRESVASCGYGGAFHFSACVTWEPEMSMERFGQNTFGSSWLIVVSAFLLEMLVSVWFIDQTAAQSPQVPASVASYPLQDPVGLQVTETQAIQPASSIPATATEAARQGSIGDYYQLVPSQEMLGAGEIAVDLSSEESLDILEEACEVIDGQTVCLPPSLTQYMLDPYRSYREDESYISYMPGDGEQFGWLTFGGNTWLNRSESSGLEMNFNLHLLSGPEVVALPPRLYDFEIGYQSKTSLSQKFSYDYGLSVGIYSDFEDSARDGVRFPAHLVGMVHPNENWDWVFGVEYVDRDDIKILPVIGFVWHDTSLPGLRVEAVFPRPRIDLQLQRDMRLYWTARLGGGTWDIEMPDDSNDVFTYRDYQILMGLESIDAKKKLSALEFGFVFGRHIEFRNRPDEVNLDESFIIRHVTRY